MVPMVAIRSDMRRLWPLNTFLVESGGNEARSTAAPRRTVGDWFSGPGGSSLGATAAGGVPTTAIERQSKWAEAYAMNFGVTPGCDVSTVGPDAAPLAPEGSIVLQLMSPGCSPFSQAGKGLGLRDPEVVAIWDQTFLRLKLERPKVFVCENETGLATKDKGKVLEWVLKGFQSAGYVTAYKLSPPPQWCSLASNRPRIYIL
jgi:site-specific DNA-cytosine methylase